MKKGIRLFYNALIVFAISMAEMAALYPLLPALVPARSMACSIVFVVNTPKITGTPVDIEASATPRAAAPATYSK
jgi:hypothetical protein